ncbi:MAG: hypothetical protein ABIG60_03600 [Patescibacteria group bacterium]
MDKQTKQANILHSFLVAFKNDISEEIIKSISKNFNIPVDVVKKESSPFITSLFVYLLHKLTREKIENGDEVAKKFLVSIGKSDDGLKDIYDLYGEDDDEAEAAFVGNLEYHLGLVDNIESRSILEEDEKKMDVFFRTFYFLRIKTACDTIINIADKEVNNMELKNGVLDYNDATYYAKSFEYFAEQAKNNPNMFMRNKHMVIKLKCPFCNHEGETTYGSIEFKVLGKDKMGWMCFECPKCKNHLRFDPITGDIDKIK